MGFDSVASNATAVASKANDLGDASLAKLAAGFATATSNMVKFISAVKTSTPPKDQNDLVARYQPVLSEVEKLEGLSNAVRGNYVFHAKAINEATQAFYWVSQAAPAKYIVGIQEAVDFHANRVLAQSRGAPDGEVSQQFVRALRDFLSALTAAVTKEYPAGLTWGPNAASIGGAGGSSHTTTFSSPAGGNIDVSPYQLLEQRGTAVDPALGKISAELLHLAQAQHSFLKAARGQAKPVDLKNVLEPMRKIISKISDNASAIAKDDSNLMAHCQALGEAARMFMWVASERPATDIAKNYSSFEYFASKIVANKRGKATNIEWVTAMKAALQSTVEIVKEQFPHGVQWAGAAPSAAPGKKAPPPPPPGGPPPPPPPPRASGAAPSAAAGGGMSELFSEISAKGLNITSGLRHVSDSEKAYKQPNRESRGFTEADLARKKGVFQWRPQAGAKRFELVDNKKWVVEYFQESSESAPELAEGEVHVNVQDTDKKHVVFISRCADVMIRIHGKVNSVQIMECASVQVEIGDTVGPVDVTASEGVELFIRGVVPSVITGKVKDFTAHLMGSLETEFVTSSTTGANITYTGINADGERGLIEISIPQQFISSIGKRDALVTRETEHSGA